MLHGLYRVLDGLLQVLFIREGSVCFSMGFLGLQTL